MSKHDSKQIIYNYVQRFGPGGSINNCSILPSEEVWLPLRLPRCFLEDVVVTSYVHHSILQIELPLGLDTIHLRTRAGYNTVEPLLSFLPIMFHSLSCLMYVHIRTDTPSR